MMKVSGIGRELGSMGIAKSIFHRNIVQILSFYKVLYFLFSFKDP